MDKYAISRNIKNALNDMGLTQKELAKNTGLSEVTLSRYMNGIRQPTAYSLYRIALALKVPVESLMDGIEDGNDEKAQEIIRKDFDDFENLESGFDDSEIIRTCLTEREKTVLKMRLCESKTLQEVANQFNVTRERIRQIEAKGLRKLVGKDVMLKEYLE